MKIFTVLYSQFTIITFFYLCEVSIEVLQNNLDLITIIHNQEIDQILSTINSLNTFCNQEQ